MVKKYSIRAKRAKYNNLTFWLLNSQLSTSSLIGYRIIIIIITRLCLDIIRTEDKAVTLTLSHIRTHTHTHNAGLINNTTRRRAYGDYRLFLTLPKYVYANVCVCVGHNSKLPKSPKRFIVIIQECDTENHKIENHENRKSPCIFFFNINNCTFT